jgi:hypothetical protein
MELRKLRFSKEKPANYKQQSTLKQRKKAMK